MAFCGTFDSPEENTDCCSSCCNDLRDNGIETLSQSACGQGCTTTEQDVELVCNEDESCLLGFNFTIVENQPVIVDEKSLCCSANGELSTNCSPNVFTESPTSVPSQEPTVLILNPTIAPQETEENVEEDIVDTALMTIGLVLVATILITVGFCFLFKAKQREGRLYEKKDGDIPIAYALPQKKEDVILSTGVVREPNLLDMVENETNLDDSLLGSQADLSITSMIKDIN
eukprot:snap_masked-scaffold_74-processed-gene-0.62-mRNA-1 protein AED:1.00 eAED:1.00 QI:0/-1/0/0/-1/1/1/0/229